MEAGFDFQMQTRFLKAYLLKFPLLKVIVYDFYFFSPLDSSRMKISLEYAPLSAMETIYLVLQFRGLFLLLSTV